MRPFVRRFSVAVTLTLILACGVLQHQQPAAYPPVRPAARAADQTTCDTLTPNLNQIVPGLTVPTWRTWGTSTQVFPTQYNPWQPTGVGGAALEVQNTPRPVTINDARNQASVPVFDITNPAPIYGVNPAIASNPDYQQCLQPIGGTNPQLYSLRDGQVFQSNGDLMVAAVSYNQAALENILNTNLYNAATLDGNLPAQSTSPSNSIPLFPSDSIVLKVMLWPVAGGGSSWTAVTALPIWDWDENKPGSPSDGRYAGYEMQRFWTRAAAIASGPVAARSVQRVQFLYGVLGSCGKPLGPNTYDDGQVVGLDRFYYKTYSDTELAAMSPCDRAIRRIGVLDVQPPIPGRRLWRHDLEELHDDDDVREAADQRP